MIRIQQRLRQAGQAERGAVSVLGVGILICFISFFAIVFSMLTSATADRRLATTASDAVVLAGGHQISEALNRDYHSALGAETNAQFFSYAGTSLRSYFDGVSSYAEQFAPANGTNLRKFRFLGPDRLYAKVQRKTPVVRSDDVKMEASSYAKIILNDAGFCLRRGTVGILYGGSCLMSMPEDLDPEGVPDTAGMPDDVDVRTVLIAP